jgi:protein-disulfide isomerase
VSDDDSELPRDEAAPRPRKKKKRRVVTGAAPLLPVATVSAAPTGFTGAHLAAALAAGVLLGGIGGWAMRGNGAPVAGTDVAKDSSTAAAQVSARATPTARPQPPAEPAAPVYIALADYSPREGPQHAKVTIVEFSDFQ